MYGSRVSLSTILRLSHQNRIIKKRHLYGLCAKFSWNPNISKTRGSFLVASTGDRGVQTALGTLVYVP